MLKIDLLFCTSLYATPGAITALSLRHALLLLRHYGAYAPAAHMAPAAHCCLPSLRAAGRAVRHSS